MGPCVGSLYPRHDVEGKRSIFALHYHHWTLCVGPGIEEQGPGIEKVTCIPDMSYNTWGSSPGIEEPPPPPSLCGPVGRRLWP